MGTANLHVDIQVLDSHALGVRINVYILNSPQTLSIRIEPINWRGPELCPLVPPYKWF
jgi:hypothetical protein